MHLYGQRQWPRCGVTLVHTPQSLALLRSGGSCQLSLIRVASAADVSSQQIITQQAGHSIFPHLTAELVCEYVTKEMCKLRVLITILPDV